MKEITLTQGKMTAEQVLNILEAWRDWKNRNWVVGCGVLYWEEEAVFIQKLRTNLEAVREQGIEDGWWKDE